MNRKDTITSILPLIFQYASDPFPLISSCKSISKSAPKYKLCLEKGQNGYVRFNKLLLKRYKFKYLSLNFKIMLKYRFTDDDLVNLAGHIEVLELYSYALISDNGLKYLKNIKKLLLDHDPERTVSLITDIGLQHLSGIEDLSLICNNNITNKGLSYLKGIQKLNLPHCKLITDIGISYLDQITYLELGKCEKITDDALPYLANANYISLRSPEITDKGLAHISKVKSLHLPECQNITNGGLSQLLYLKALTLGGIDITEDRIGLHPFKYLEQMNIVYLDYDLHMPYIKQSMQRIGILTLREQTIILYNKIVLDSLSRYLSSASKANNFSVTF